MEVVWNGADGVQIVWNGVETRGDGAGVDLMAKASRGRARTCALENRWSDGWGGEQEPRGVGHMAQPPHARPSW